MHKNTKEIVAAISNIFLLTIILRIYAMNMLTTHSYLTIIIESLIDGPIIAMFIYLYYVCASSIVRILKSIIKGHRDQSE